MQNILGFSNPNDRCTFFVEVHIILLCTEKLAKKRKGNLEFSLAIQNQVMGAVLHEIECFMEMQEKDFFGKDAAGIER